MAEVLERGHEIQASFDRQGDVLYLSLGSPRRDEGEDRTRGVVLRYGLDDDRPTGVTIIGFVANGWSENLSAAAEIVASHLSIDKDAVVASINNAKLSG